MRPSRAHTCLTSLAAVALVAGCTTTPAVAPAPSSASLEKTVLTIGYSPVPSAAPVFLADKKGFFKEEGLTIKLEPIQAPQEVMPKVANGSMDVVAGSYVSLLSIHGSGNVKIRILADGIQARPRIAGVVVSKNSPIKSPQDLKGKTIGVNSLNNLGTLTVSAHLQIHDLTPKDVKFVEIPFLSLSAALETKQVDAAWLVEPFVSAQEKKGATLLIDTNVGPTDALPIDGWATTDTWAEKHPNAAAAFQRAVVKAQRELVDNPSLLAEVVPTYAKIDKQTVLTMAKGEFSTSREPARIQRVADLMKDFGYLKGVIDVAPMIVGSSGN